MQTILLGVLIVGSSMAVGVLGLIAVNRRFPHQVRQSNNEVADPFIGVLSGVYGILVAFMVVVVWERFETARDIVEREGNALDSVFRGARLLPQPAADQVHDAARKYAQVLIDEEWPAMEHGQGSPRAAQM